MNDQLKKILIIVGIVAGLLIAVLLVILVMNLPQRTSTTSSVAPTEPITLKYWSTFDDADDVSDIIAKYRESHPNVAIEFRKFRFEEYEKELLNALAEDRGPDIFSLHNTWIGGYVSKLAPMPDILEVQRVQTQKKGFGGEVLVGSIEEVPGYTPKYMRDTFVPAVIDDVMFPNEEGNPLIYALPMYVDTLSLFYNPRLFNSAGIPLPPTNWIEFEESIKKLTVIAPDTHEILQSGAAFGTGRNIDRAFDILSSLMAQNGTVLSTAGRVTFSDKSPYVKESTINPAAEALRFYTDFAWVTKADVYTWNQDQPNSVESFSQERAAMMFGYSYHREQIKTKAPSLQFEIAPLPQKQQELKKTYANYWAEGVSNKSKYQDMAWDFIMFATAQDNVGTYLEKTQRPTALRALIDQQIKNDITRPFASQLLIAENWYHGINAAAAEKAFFDMIDAALLSKGGEIDEERSVMESLVYRAQQTISDSYRQ